jgi:hypothetical protein
MKEFFDTLGESGVKINIHTFSMSVFSLTCPEITN